MITVAVTAYRESERGAYAWIRECVAAAAEHPLVDEVLVVDDGSDDSAGLRAELDGTPKLRVERLEPNHGVFGAKVESVLQAASEWVAMIDSDNVAAGDFFDRLAELRPWDPRILYSPSFGRPELDYRHLCGRWSLSDVPRLLRAPLSGCAVNTGNQLVHRDSFGATFSRFRGPRFDLLLPDYLGAGDRADLRWRRVYDSADSLFINSRWWLAGGAVEFVRGLEYVHGSLTPEHRAVAPSSWDRAPAEKDRMPGIFLRELVEAAARVA